MTDPAATVVHATGHQIVSVCRSGCEEETALLLNSLMSCEFVCSHICLDNWYSLHSVNLCWPN